MTVAKNKSKWSQNRFAQASLLCAAVAVALTLAGATLQARPAIRNPEHAFAPVLSEDFQQSLSRANRQLQELAEAVDGQLAPAADNLLIARRLSLALVGSGMSLEEMRALEDIPRDQQITWFTSYLVNDRRWADYFAERFSRAFVGTNDGAFLLFRKRKFNTWLADQLDQGTSYAEIVREMISAQGLWTDKPQVNFITATMDESSNGRADPVRLAGRTSRAFLAQRIDCLQCHDDFLGQLNFGDEQDVVSGRQEHFHRLAAFYAEAALPKMPLRGITDDGQAYEVELLSKPGKQTLTPDVPFAKSILNNEGSRRQQLAAWVTHPENRAFARSVVNRTWALMFGRPLVSPVDSIPLDDSVPPVLDTLATDFSQHDYDLRRLIYLIAETDAFRRSSRADFEITLAHEECWAVFPITQLRPEQVVGSVFQASKLTALDSSSSILTRLKIFGDTRSFLKRFGDRGDDEFDSDSVTIAQRLLLMNGNLVTEQTKVDLVNNASSRIAALVPDPAQAIELAFLCALNRRPSEIESLQFVDYLKDKRGDARSQALGDIYWAMINSTEFSWNH
ncbi:MAG: DUF1553 domain-containing protein [Planctomycetales bacterium]|nr:DUF1553 domain-containing protein [Planctomycetales bacterium]MCA9135998.1 DUF1553 domain-containing protein [Planctomycetales bacterium]